MENIEPGAAQEQAVSPEASAEQGTEDVHLLLQDARNKADEHWNQLLRVKADLENLRRRGERDLEHAHRYGLERFVQELLPIKDSLELGLTASQDSEGDVVKGLREGMELTRKMLQNALEKFGVKELNPQGERFNPELHQAMSVQERADAEPNTVLLVGQKGYLLHDRLIRPAMVIVSKAPESSAEDPRQA
jgi:molecular chaperone GrpE